MKPHKDLIRNDLRSGGYSIRVGKDVPVNAANLAYVSTKPVSPDDNLLLEDRSSLIQENGLPTYVAKEMLVFPNKSYQLEAEQGQRVFPSDNLLVSDEFTVRRHMQDEPKPLYFRMECKGRFDAKGSTVLPYEGGRSTKFTGDAVRYEEIGYEQQSDLLYMGDLIRIQDEKSSSNQALPYKIHLVREGTGTLYRIQIFTSFRGDENHSYKVTYPNFENGKVTLKEEVLNTYPFFERVTYEELMETLADPTPEKLSKKEYAIKPTDNGYEVYAGSQVMIANAVTRPPQWFRYRTEAQLKTKLSETNPGTLRMGVMYLNKTVYNIENLFGIGKVLATNALKPNYLTLENPHPKDPSWLPSDVRYWQADLDMPAHQYYDYDILFLTGYGVNDLSAYRDYFEDYLSQGGVLWLDNGGELEKALTFVTGGENTFLTNIDFSKTQSESGSKRIVIDGSYKNRMYLLSDNVTELGYDKVTNKIVFGPGERLENWNVHIQFGSGGPALMERSMYGKGTLMVSNCGLLRSVYHNDELTMKFLYNILLTHAEKQWFASPWRQDYVFHRDNLFEQEYLDSVGNQVYVDDRNDLDNTQIVAKKQLGKTCRDMLLPHVKPWYQNAVGSYYPVINSDNEVAVPNNDFESVSLDANGAPIVQWTTTKEDAIPSWNTKVFAGTAVVFRHIDSITARGMKSVGIEAGGEGSQSFWESTKLFLPADTYEIKGWVKTTSVVGKTTDGAKIGLYKPDGSKIATSLGITESRNWMEVKFTVSLQQAQDVYLRLGFVDGNGTGTIYFDNISVLNKGSVHITPDNTGARTLYAYAVNPKGETIDIHTQGFVEEDIARIQPVIPFTLMIRSFTYKWQNLTRRYEREYGNSSSYNLEISKSDGVKTYGYLHSMLPALPDGAEWQDKNRVYYELIGYSQDGFVNPLVNMSLYDTEKGKEYYLKNGELVIGYMDLFWARLDPTILVQAQTPYETIRATRRHFGLKLTNEDRVYTELPRTKDAREAWFLRVHNGAFIKGELGYQEWAGLVQNQGQSDTYSKRTLKTQVYKIPEYENQVFHPYEGVMSVENQVEYINRRMVRVPHNKLFVEWGHAEQEEVKPIDGEKKVFEASRERWDERVPVTVYVDPNMNGTYVELEEGFDIDYERGLIIFEETVVGNVRVSYGYCNLRLYKRTYGNGKIANEVLSTEDKKTYVSRRPFWLYQPAPILKNKPGIPTPETVISPIEYTVDYKKGLIKFAKDNARAIYADYAYYTQTEVEVEDYDAQNGILYLKQEIDFQDDLFAVYSYEEDFYEYRGYYNSELRQFLHLDLNPSVGHYSTLPASTVVGNTTAVVYKTVPSSQLLNKEIHVYIVPESMGGASIRHCFSALEWQKIQQSNPMCLLLAKVYVREHTNVNQTIVMDARTRGGGIKENITEQEIAKRVQGKQRYWDIGSWNGKAYYRNGTLIIRLPKTVLVSNGGSFTEEQVDEMLQKYVAFGTYVIVEYI